MLTKEELLGYLREAQELLRQYGHAFGREHGLLIEHALKLTAFSGLVQAELAAACAEHVDLGRGKTLGLSYGRMAELSKAEAHGRSIIASARQYTGKDAHELYGAAGLGEIITMIENT